MARLFDAGSTEYLTRNQAVLSGVPLALVAWFSSDDLTIAQTIMSISDVSVQADYHRLIFGGNLGGDPITAQTCQATCARALSSTGCLANTWYHGCALFVSATDRRALLNGGSKGTNATSKILALK